MFGSLFILFILPYTDISRHRGSQFRPVMKLFHLFFFVNFFILMWIGSQHPETPFVEIGQFATFFYFSWFFILVPTMGVLENTVLTLLSNEPDPDTLNISFWQKNHLFETNSNLF